MLQRGLCRRRAGLLEVEHIDRHQVVRGIGLVDDAVAVLVSRKLGLDEAAERAPVELGHAAADLDVDGAPVLRDRIDEYRGARLRLHLEVLLAQGHRGRGAAAEKRDRGEQRRQFQ